MNAKHNTARALLACLAALAACSRPEGIAPSKHDGGARIVWESDAKPLPRIPLPNDAATRLDPSSPTGRRINVSLDAPTAYERALRAKVNRLDGFAPFGTVLVSFDAPLDPLALKARHSNDDFRDDAVYLLNVDRSCRRFGEEVMLDIGRGRFPVSLDGHSTRHKNEAAPDGYVLDEGGNPFFEYDPNGESNNTLFEDRNEDANGNGVLDPGEDTDEDGVLDVANLDDPKACDALPHSSMERDRCLADHLMTFYDRQDNGLHLRTFWPLEEGCRYAVVLTNRLVDAKGKPVESPFPGVNPRDQTQALEPLAELLPRYGLGLPDVAFAWTFTVAKASLELETLRAGLYGSGPFSRLATEFPVTSLAPGAVNATAKGQRGAVTSAGCSASAMTSIWSEAQGEWRPNLCALEADNAAIGGLFWGRYDAPNFLADQDGAATEKYPADNDETWSLDPLTGEGRYGSASPTFWCSLPLEKDTSCSPGNPEGKPFCRPFPVILYAHGYGGARAELTAHVGRTNAMGYATCGIDSYGHGLNRALEVGRGTFDPVMSRYGQPGLMELLFTGRDRDLNNDLLTDPGADQWTADLFHTRDMVRQSALEYSQFVRILRSFDGARRTSDGAGVLGDFDGDGKVDLGGPQNTVSMWGISLGGIIAGVLAGSEPGLDAVSPNAGAAGLPDVSVRSRQSGIGEMVHLVTGGPVVAGFIPTDDAQNPDAGEPMRVVLFASDITTGIKKLEFEVARVPGARPGDKVEVTNLVNGTTRTATVNARGWWRVGIPADALDPVEKRPLIGLERDDQLGPKAPEDNLKLGDGLRVVVRDGATGEVRKSIDTFEKDLSFQGALYKAGTPLVALQRGLGLRRNSPEFRRFLAIAQTVIAAGDPGTWAAKYYEEPIDTSYDTSRKPRQTRVLVMPTAGDFTVPVNTGVALGRAAGFLGSWKRDESLPAEHGWRPLFTPDARFGKSVDQHLVDEYVVEGDTRYHRFVDPEFGIQVPSDVDDDSDGTLAFGCGDEDWSSKYGETRCPAELRGRDPEAFFRVRSPGPGKALRMSLARPEGGHDAFRVPVLRPHGQHGIYNAQPFRRFDADAYMVNFTLRFLGSRGREVAHAAGCDCSATAVPASTLAGAPNNPGLRDRVCAPADLRLCNASCSTQWGLRTPEAVSCEPR